LSKIILITIGIPKIAVTEFIGTVPVKPGSCEIISLTTSIIAPIIAEAGINIL
jgi:hypothetical protein